MYYFRKAEKNHANELTELAISSEAYWGYDEAFLEAFKKSYNISEMYIQSNPVFILYSDDLMIGFYGLLLTEEEVTLEYLFVKPEYIGLGHGKRLWNHMLLTCKAYNITNFFLVTSPQAKEFYLKLGAIYIEDVDSLVIKNRKIPKLLYQL